jgi:RHS repeat-associated protein
MNSDTKVQGIKRTTIRTIWAALCAHVTRAFACSREMQRRLVGWVAKPSVVLRECRFVSRLNPACGLLTWAAIVAVTISMSEAQIPGCRATDPNGNWECTVHPIYKPKPDFEIGGPVQATGPHPSLDDAINAYKAWMSANLQVCGLITHDFVVPSGGVDWTQDFVTNWNYGSGYIQQQNRNINFRYQHGPNCDADTIPTFYAKTWRYFTCGPAYVEGQPFSMDDDVWKFDNNFAATTVCKRPIEPVCGGQGNPVLEHAGVKFQRETDFSSPSIGVQRVYRTQSDVGVPGIDQSLTRGRFGRFWQHGFETRLWATSDTPLAGGTVKYARIFRDNYAYYFFGTGTTVNGKQKFVARAEQNDSLDALMNGQGAITGWQYRGENDSTELYSPTGRLLSFTTRAGVVQTLNYETNPPAGQEPKLLSVVDSYNRSLTFTYHPDTATTGAGNIATVSDHLGNVVSYAYDANNNLVTVTYPSGGIKTYHYNEQALTANTNLPNALTGITDENGVRYATYQYDSSGRAISTEHAGGVNKYSLNYTSPYSQTIVTDPLGTQRTYNFQTILGVVKTTGVDQPCPSCGGSQSQATTYDANGNVASRTDFNNKKTCYAYDLARNLETARVEGLDAAADCATELAKPVTAFTTADQKKIETLWHATYRLPTKITEPAATTTIGGVPKTKVTDFTYDANGNMLTRKTTAPKNDGTTGNDIRTWTYTYNALGQVLTAKDPLNRTTTTVYYAATDTSNPPKYTMGDVATITNAANHVVTMNEYDKNGRLLKMTDANGLVTTMTYHPRGWMTSRAVSNGTNTETTFYVYDNVGQLTRVVLPDQSNLFYAYDDAHRLVGMSDQLINASPSANGALIVKDVNLSGNKIVYVLDNMGNRIKEQHYDPSGVLQKQKQRAIDALNRLKQDVGGTAYASAAPNGAPVLDASVTGPLGASAAPTNASISQYGYDNNGNLTSTTDPLGRVTQNQYDALNRLTQVIDPQNGATKPTIYTYDAQNNLTQVTDPQGLQTKYTYNGHGNLIKQESPDTGTTQTKVNAVGNVIAKIDSMNRCTTTAYDALHRPTNVKFYAATNVSTNTPALCFGTIAGTVTPEETHTYTYDSITASLGGPGGKGRLSRIADAAGRVDYVYDLFGRITSKTNVLTGATNPNRVVTYAYNTNGQLRSTTYPSGNTIAYTYGSPSSINPGKIIGIMLNPAGYTATANGGSTPTGGVNLITNSDYKPFGPNWGWDWGNSCDTNNLATCTTSSTPRINQHLRQFDLDYRPITIASDPEGYNRLINWDRANRITSINVPSGITIPGLANAQSTNQAFGYDALDRLTNFTPGVTGATTLATGLALLPKEDFTYDAIGNRLTRATQAPGSTATQTANYSYPNTDATPTANRRHVLNSIAGAQTNAYTYDASGNTLTESAALATMNPATGQMNSTGTTQALAYTYDAKNRLSKAQVGSNTADFVSYKIHAMGQRVQKLGAGAYAFNSSLTIDAATGQSPLARTVNFNARYVYDESGRLIGEYTPDGKLISETIYFNDLPIATIRPKGANAGVPLGIGGTTTGNPANGATAANANNVGNNSTTNRVNVEIFYIHADHLGTPRTVTRSTVATGANAPSSATSTSPGAINKAVWRWDSDPFGTSLDNSKPTENPQLIAGTATVKQAGTFKQNLRFPGQLADGESAKYYNYFRDYDSSVGRYSTSDPIGLDGGWNTFGYVKAKPTVAIDPKGLALWSCLRSCCGGVANHAYLYDDETSDCCGDPGPSRDSTNFIKTCKEKGPNGDTCTLVSLNSGDAKKALSCCDRRTRNSFYWPGQNDCHNRVEECVNELGFVMTTTHSRRRFQACDSCYKRDGIPPSLGPMP